MMIALFEPKEEEKKPTPRETKKERRKSLMSGGIRKIK